MNQEYDFSNPVRKPVEAVFREYLGIVSRGKWIILLALIVTISTACIYIQLKKPLFRAVATLVINARLPRNSTFVNMVTLGTERNLSQNILETLQSHSLQENVALKLVQKGAADSSGNRKILILRQDAEADPARSVPLTEVVIQRFKTAVSFSIVPGTDMIKIQAESKDPAEAALIANLFAESVYETNLFHSRAKSRAFRQFLEAQLQDKRRILDETELKLQEFMQNKGVVSLDDETKKIVGQLGELEAQRDAVDIAIHSLRKTLESNEEELARREVNVAKSIGDASDPYIRLLQEQLAALEVKRDVTAAQTPTTDVEKGVYDEKTKEVNEQITTLRNNLAQRTDDYIKTLLPAGAASGASSDPLQMLQQLKQKVIESRIEMQTQIARKNALDSVITQYSRRFSTIPGRSIEFARLQRAHVSSEKLYLSVQDKFNEAVINEQSEFGYVEIIEPATVPIQPASPKRLMTIALGIVGGLVFGLIAVVARERLNLKVQTPEDLKQRGFQVLSTIVRFDDAAVGRNGGGSGNGNGRPIPSPVLRVPFSPAAESYRHLRTSILYSRRNPDVHTILLTSSKPGEGKSTTVMNLGIVCAQAGKHVLLIDSDFRRPCLHLIFEADPYPGLADVLLGKAGVGSVIRQTTVPNLSLITAGTTLHNPAELLGSGALRLIVDEVRNRFDIVIFDSSPLLVATDTTVLSSVADNVVVVAAAGDTRIRELEQACELMGEVYGKLPEIVLNKYDVGRAYGMKYGHYTYGSYRYIEPRAERKHD